ncbi:MAG: hypothetical protein JNN13_19375 [Planctomycetes bacterium]|nr:hypothetical protein [Planctomycetota bacterium]
MRTALASGEAAPSASLYFLDLGTAAAVRELPVRLAGSDGVSFAGDTDQSGGLEVPPGHWTILGVGEHYELASAETDAAEVDAVGDQQRVVWVTEVLDCRIHVVTLGGQPIADACVAYLAEGQMRPQRARTDIAGWATLAAVSLSGSGMVTVWRHGFDAVSVSTHAIDPATHEMTVTMSQEPAGRDLTLECVDDRGLPATDVDVHWRSDGPGRSFLWLGSTDDAGRLFVGPIAGRLPGELWFRGPVSQARLRFEDWQSSEPLRVRLSRPVRGALVLDTRGVRIDSVQVLVTDASAEGAASGKVRIDACSGRSTVVDGCVPLDLPRDREVEIRCSANDGRSVYRRFKALDRDWRLPLAFEAASAGCAVTLIAHNGAIGKVFSRGCVVPAEVVGGAVKVHIGPGPVNFEVQGAGDAVANLAFDGRIDADCVIDVRFPLEQWVELVVRDTNGRPMPDVRLKLARTTNLDRTVVPGTSLRQFLGRNNIECSPGADGRARVRLVQGEYGVALSNLTVRDRVLDWTPTSGAAFVVPGPAQIMVVGARARRVLLTLDADVRLPDPWFLYAEDGNFLGAYHGRVNAMWCPDEMQAREIRAPSGPPLVRFEVPPGVRELLVAVRGLHR